MTRPNLRHAYAELKRLRWLIAVIVVAIAALDVLSLFHELSKYALVVYALCKGATAAIVWHLVRSEMFPYIDLEQDLRSGDPGRAIGASIVVLATALLFLGVVLAV